MIASRLPHMTAVEYLEWEKTQEMRHEYGSKDIYAMTGGSKAHNTITGNLFTEIRAHLRSGPCQTFFSDVKVQISAEGPFFYPDLLVTCNEQDNQPGYTVEHPCLIVEVLSPSTEAGDRGSKFRYYRRLNALQEYVLIDSQEMSVECFRRPATLSTWSYEAYSSGDVVKLESIDLDVPMNRLYAEVQFES
ncbi:MAG: Uma2 family endonuclease [Gemmatimonadaceae bacterium]|nr:Uma2 family endonuclease [Gloeobacterales cyanobacterium ES-bin-141]